MQMFRKLWRIKAQLIAPKGWQQVKLGVSYPTLPLLPTSPA